MPGKITLREMARRIGLSHTTVSEALRDHPRVGAETRARVQKLARELGYRRNALAGAVMSEVRRRQVDRFQGTLAVLDLNEESRRLARVTRFSREIAEGATRRAEELWFKLDAFSTRAEGLTLSRLRGILATRGIRGLLLLPMPQEPELASFDWSSFSSIYTDYVIRNPGLHCICSDHYRGMMAVLDRLRELGYRRPGLVLQSKHDKRLLHRWEAAFVAYQNHHDEAGRVAPLILDQVTEREFKRWFRASKCDVVASHFPEVRTWMEEAGARVPETHGFCCLNLVNTSEPCAGLDLQPRLLGERGMELLVGQVMRNECGVPARPMTATIQPEWVDGPTLRRMG